MGFPVGLAADVLGESCDGGVKFGFGESVLEAEFESIPQ